MPEPSIYDYLAKKNVSELTISELNSATKLTNLDPLNAAFWQGVITLNRVLSDSRTMPHGLPIPELSLIEGQACPPSEAVQFQPTGTELWEIIGIQIIGAGGTPIVSAELFNGSESVIMAKGTFGTSAGSLFPFESSFIIDNAMYLQITNEDGSNAINASIAYHKVAL